MEVTCSSETFVDFNELHSIMLKKIEFFITAAVRTAALYKLQALKTVLKLFVPEVEEVSEHCRMLCSEFYRQLVVLRWWDFEGYDGLGVELG
jgi:hypothetical protein